MLQCQSVLVAPKKSYILYKYILEEKKKMKQLRNDDYLILISSTDRPEPTFSGNFPFSVLMRRLLHASRCPVVLGNLRRFTLMDTYC